MYKRKKPFLNSTIVLQPSTFATLTLERDTIRWIHHFQSEQVSSYHPLKFCKQGTKVKHDKHLQRITESVKAKR